MEKLLPQPVRGKDFTDDRLADLLRFLSEDEWWEAIEAHLGRRLVRVYDLGQGPVRLDSTTAAVYHDTKGKTLFRRGHSKDHRPDLLQFKVMLAAMDPLGMPLATLVVGGNKDDDGLYEPAITRARRVVGQGGRLYIGDVKMGALNTRAFVQAGGDYYLTPLARTGKVPRLLTSLLELVWHNEQPLCRIHLPADEGPDAAQERLLALGFEVPHLKEAEVTGQTVTWEERLPVVYSPSQAKKARRGLAQRLARAEKSLLDLTPPRGREKRQWDDLAALQAEAQAILKKYRVEELLEVSYSQEVEQRAIRQYRDRPARVKERVRYIIQVQRRGEAIAAARRLLGRRLYATNAPTKVLPLTKAVLTYRDTPRIERDFRRLKVRSLGIRPLYVQCQDHVQGMVRLLSLALRVLTLIEHVVRKGLQAVGQTLKGLYAGNPKRQTAHPTTERLLKAFQGITLTLVQLPNQTIRHVTPLSELQQRILSLLGLLASIYENLALPVDPILP